MSAIVDGDRTYIRSTPQNNTGVSAFPLLAGGPIDQYSVRHWVGGTLFEAVCPYTPSPQTFECMVFGSILSWTDESGNPYSILAVNDGVETFLEAGGGRRTTVTGVDDRYIVRHFATGTPVETSCPGGSFECSVTGSQLTWDDQYVFWYYVRAVNDGSETYLGSAGGIPYFRVSGDDDSYIVRYWVGPRLAEATCSPNNG